MRLIQSSFLIIILLSASLSPAIANESSADYCAVSTGSTGTLGEARALFQNSCANYSLTDCDPIKGGGWECSSAVIGASAPGGPAASNSVQQNTNNTTSTATVSAANSTANNNASLTTESNGSSAVVTTGNSEVSVNSSATPVIQSSDTGECYVVATGLEQAKIAFAQQCSNHQRNDCDPLGNNRWVCSSANISNTQMYTEEDSNSSPVVVDRQLTVNTDTDTASDNTNNEISIPDIANAQIVTSNPTPTNSQVGRLAANDLLVLHYDNCPDKDDGQAIPAGKSVVEKYEINNVLVVNGTCGNSIRDRFNSASHAVMKASWGTEYLDAHGQSTLAVQQASTRWASTLSNGADVWIAEGGQSDFTANVVRQIESRYSNIDLKRIHVIQHSAGSTAYNEKFTDSSNLSYLKNKTSYTPIANGNVGGNGTADLNQQSVYFVVSARASRFSAEWNAGFDYLPPDCSVRTENCKLDFSDTVELLYIIDDQSTQNVNDFANNYLN